jgi:hypothetical protein
MEWNEAKGLRAGETRRDPTRVPDSRVRSPDRSLTEYLALALASSSSGILFCRALKHIYYCVGRTVLQALRKRLRGPRFTYLFTWAELVWKRRD